MFVPYGSHAGGFRRLGRDNAEKLKGKAVLRVMWRALREIFAFPYRVAVDLLLLFIQNLLTILPPVFMSQMLMDNVLLRQPMRVEPYMKLPQARLVYWITSPWHNAGPETLLWVSLIGLMLLALLGSFIAVFYTWWDVSLKNRLVHRLRARVMDHFLHMSLGFHGSQRVGDIIYRVQQDSQTIQPFYQQGVLGPWTQILGLSTRLGSMFLLSPRLTLIMVASFPFAIALNYVLIMPLRKAARRAREADSGLMSKIEGTFGAIKAVVAFAKEKEEADHYREQSWEALQWARRRDVWGSILAQSVNQTMSIGRFLVIALGGYAVWHKEMSPGQWLMMTNYMWMIQQPVMALTTLWSTLQNVLVGLDRVFKVLDQQPEIDNTPDAQVMREIGNGIEFRDVTFEYEAGKAVLNGINLRSKPGTVTALVGPVGSGKSTLISLIPRLIDPSSGQVLINGRDLREYTLESIRNNVSFVLQENQLFPRTVLQNILYGAKLNGLLPQTGVSLDEVTVEMLTPELQEQLSHVAKSACLEEFLQNLPDHLDTFIGEHASRLSGGEKQRIAIARALIRQSPVLLLDEPTASLDAETESRMLANLRALSEGRIIYIVAHRLTTVRHADQICFMRNGQILETGTHAELMDLPDGNYRRFYEMQFEMEGEKVEQLGPPAHA